MTTFQKVVKYFAIALAACLIVGIVGGIYRIGSFFFNQNGVSDEIKSYSLSQNITDIKVEIAAADFTVSSGTDFSVESNLEYLTVEEKDGTLILTETEKYKNYNGAVLKLCIPKNTVLESADITTGAGKLTVESLAAKELHLVLGAGKSEITE